MDRAETAARIAELIGPFNKKGVAIGEATTFAGDLEWDSLTVMDFVAAIEEGSTAARVGFQKGDIIQALNGEAMTRRAPIKISRNSTATKP